MFYLIGLLRKTALFGFIMLPVTIFAFDVQWSYITSLAHQPMDVVGYYCAYIFYSLFAYPILVVLHILLIKVVYTMRKDSDSGAIETFFCGLGADITSPFRHTGTFLSVVTRRHIIQDDSKFHNSVDFLQVLFDFAWVVVLIVFIIVGIQGL